MIKNVVFDLGGVLIDYRPRDYVYSFNFSEDISELLLSQVFENPLWAEIDRGLYTLAEGIEIVSEVAPKLKDILPIVFHENWMDMYKTKHDTVNLVKRLKDEGFKLYILSNFSEEGFTFVKGRNDFFDLFDGEVVSYRIKSVKPEKQIYDYLLKTMGIDAIETVFLDDMPQNIEAAGNLGIKGIVFKDAVSAESKLREIIAEN